MIRKVHKVLCLATGPLIIVWFFSGMVMMYVDHPRAHRFALGRLPRMAPLVADDVSIDFQEAWAKTGLNGSLREARLNMLIDRPAYFFRSENSVWKVVYADDGSVLHSVTPEMARKSASGYLGKEMGGATISPLDEPDQWTVGTCSSPWQWPFYKLRCEDRADTWAYVSRTSGEVCQVTTKMERTLVWLGSIPHWLYFTVLRKHLEPWRQVILWLSGVGTVAVVLGLWIGISHFRWKGYGRNRYQRSSAFIGVKKWHHFLGLVFGLTTLMWVFSGMLSMSPFHWHSKTAASKEEAVLLAGGGLSPSRFILHPADALRACRGQSAVRKMDLINFDGTPYYLCWQSRDQSLLVWADESGHSPSPYLPTDEIVAASRRLVPGYRPVSHALLHAYDMYYVDKNENLRLPVVKIAFDDPAHTWFYIDVHDGTIVKRYDGTARLNRWLYRFSHCLDLPFFIRHRLLRDVLMLFFLAGGTLLAATGLYSWARSHRRKSARKV